VPERPPLLSAQTLVAGVIGDPVHQSLSPTLHNAGFAHLGLDWVYVAFPVPAGQGAAALQAMRTFGIRGLSVTMPHKATAMGGVDRLSPTASQLGVLNTVTRRGDELVGDSTDGPGLVDALRSEQGWEPQGRRVVILGTGGASRAVALALAEAGAAAVVVVGRRAEAAAAVAALAAPVGSTGPVEAIADADLIVNATPVGMVGHSTGSLLPLKLDPSRLSSGQLVADLVYAPAVTPLQVEARARGAAAVNGLGMLIHQAARQFAAWTGEPAPIEAMRAAARAELARQVG
jgi:shikimate dehydrogenase